MCNIDIIDAAFFCMRLCKQMIKKEKKDKNCEIKRSN